jgi:hypothetical protein
MPAKQVKQSKTETKTKTKTDTKTKQVPETDSDRPIVESDNDTSDSENETPVVKSKKPPAKKKITLSNDSDSDVESEVETKKSPKQAPVSEPSDGDVSNSEEDDPKYTVKKQEKKVKLSSAELATEKQTLFSKMSVLNKTIDESIIQLAKMNKERNALQRALDKHDKLHDKSTLEDLEKVRKQKPKRKGTGGFKPELVPAILRKYLDLEDDATMPRPTVNKLLTAKLKSLNLKTGREAHLDKTACTALGLNVDNKTIKFEQFMGFIGSFYPPKVSQ